MYAYVINLPRSTDRRAHMVAQLEKAGVAHEFITAVDGRELNLADTTIFDPVVTTKQNFRPGAGGAALSHLAAYRKMLADGRDTALILEDDVLLPPDLEPLSDAIAGQMSAAEIVLLNFHSFEPCRVTKTGAVQLPGGRLLTRIVDLDPVSSGAAYIITREACTRILAVAMPIKTHPDDWGHYSRTGGLDSVRCVVPMAIRNSSSLRTTIDYFRPDSLQGRVREQVARMRVPVLSQMLAVRRQQSFKRLGWVGEAEFVSDVTTGEAKAGVPDNGR